MVVTRMTKLTRRVGCLARRAEMKQQRGLFVRLSTPFPSSCNAVQHRPSSLHPRHTNRHTRINAYVERRTHRYHLSLLSHSDRRHVTMHVYTVFAYTHAYISYNIDYFQRICSQRQVVENLFWVTRRPSRSLAPLRITPDSIVAMQAFRFCIRQFAFDPLLRQGENRLWLRYRAWMPRSRIYVCVCVYI